MFNIFEEINNLNEQEIAVFLTAAKRSGYVCPKCKNGTGDSGTGITSYEFGGKLRWKCYKCGENFSNVDLLAAEWGIDAGKAEGSAEMEVRYRANSTFSPSTRDFTSNDKVAPSKVEERDYSEFYKQAQKRLESVSGEIRGLPIEYLSKVKAGIATAADLKAVGENVPPKGRYLILPYNKSHFFMRSLDNDSVKRGNTGGKAGELYNPLNALESSTVFVTEGQIDSLSVMYALNVPAIAVGGASNLPNLPRRLSEMNLPKKKRLIILADNDSAGRKGAEKAVSESEAAGLLSTYFTFSNGIEKVDANSILQSENGREKLRLKLLEIADVAEKKFAEMERIGMLQEILDIGGTGLADYFSKDFDNEVEEMRKFANRSTGFKNIDNSQILFPGLYFVGGVPSIGKTTFMWQMLEQMSREGEVCIYCSYEMSRIELFTKSVSHRLYERDKNKSLSAAQIRRGSYNDESRAVVQELKSAKLNLFVLEMS